MHRVKLEVVNCLSRGRLWAACAAAVLLAMSVVAVAGVWAQPDAGARASDAASPAGGSSGPVQRYASLKVDLVELREGPGTDYPVVSVVRRAGLPVEVLREADAWREVRGADGTAGWMRASLLSARRTALVLPGAVEEGRPMGVPAILREDDDERGRMVAEVRPGALAGIVSCENAWCRVSIDNVRGYMQQAELWGTYPNETIKVAGRPSG